MDNDKQIHPTEGQNLTPETPDTTLGGILPTTEKLFQWTMLSLKFCLVIFASLAVLLERKL